MIKWLGSIERTINQHFHLHCTRRILVIDCYFFYGGEESGGKRVTMLTNMFLVEVDYKPFALLL